MEPYSPGYLIRTFRLGLCHRLITFCCRQSHLLLFSFTHRTASWISHDTSTAMISWRSVLSVISCTLLYALFIREASRPEVAPQLSPPIAKSQSKVGQNDVSKRFYTGAMAPFTADHPLLNIRGIGKRDVCNDTFPGRYQQTCEPSRTLCCRSNKMNSAKILN